MRRIIALAAVILMGCNGSAEKRYFMTFEMKEMKNGDWSLNRRDLDTIIAANDSVASVKAYIKYSIKMRSHQYVTQSQAAESFTYTLVDVNGKEIQGNFPPETMKQIEIDVAHAVEGK